MKTDELRNAVREIEDIQDTLRKMEKHDATHSLYVGVGGYSLVDALDDGSHQAIAAIVRVKWESKLTEAEARLRGIMSALLAEPDHKESRIGGMVRPD